MVVRIRPLFRCLALAFASHAIASYQQERLIEDLFIPHNKLVLPNDRPDRPLKLVLAFNLLQILDVHEKRQVLRLNGHLIHVWANSRLRWSPQKYGGITSLHIPNDMVWLPDILLYNNADGSPSVLATPKVHIYCNGVIAWEPPVIYNSVCEMDVEWFPFDEQHCHLKFGAWSYHGHAIDLGFYDLRGTMTTVGVDEKGDFFEKHPRGVVLDHYQESGEWDLMTVEAVKHRKRYPCCDYPFIDITYYITIRRKTLFYSLNLITPCVGIAMMSGAVFYLPSNSKSKIMLSVSVLVSISLFFLLLTDIIPATSRAIPMIAKYLLSTMLLVGASICVSIVTINIHCKASLDFPMSATARRLFLDLLPRVLFVNARRTVTEHGPPLSLLTWAFTNEKSPFSLAMMSKLVSVSLSADNLKNVAEQSQIPQDYVRAYRNACYIAEQLRINAARNRQKEDWKFVAMVVDRVFLILYLTFLIGATAYTFLRAPSLWDTRAPISQIVKEEMMQQGTRQANASPPLQC